MKIDVEDVFLGSLFLGFSIFMMEIVDGLVAKLFFVGWTISVLLCVIYFVLKEES
jgi:hypothetical protein